MSKYMTFHIFERIYNDRVDKGSFTILELLSKEPFANWSFLKNYIDNNTEGNWTANSGELYFSKEEDLNFLRLLWG